MTGQDIDELAFLLAKCQPAARDELQAGGDDDPIAEQVVAIDEVGEHVTAAVAALEANPDAFNEQLLDVAVEIPMVGTGHSLNVAVAGSLVLYRLAGLVFLGLAVRLATAAWFFFPSWATFSALREVEK